MTLEIFAIYTVSFWLLIGAFFSITGAIGLLRFSDPMTRMHAPTKVGTVGTGAILMASMIHAWVFDDGSVNEVLIMAFLFVTAPIAANFIAKVHLHHRSCDRPPPPERDRTWSTYDVPEAEPSDRDDGSR